MHAHMTTTAGRTAYAADPAGSPRSSAVMVAGLRKSYGAVQAVRGTSFAVEHGEIFALLGPNSAGKTTTLEILEGFRTRDAGQVDVLGLDPHGHLRVTPIPSRVRSVQIHGPKPKDGTWA